MKLKCIECANAQQINETTLYCKDGRCYGYRNMNSECVIDFGTPDNYYSNFGTDVTFDFHTERKYVCP